MLFIIGIQVVIFLWAAFFPENIQTYLVEKYVVPTVFFRATLSYKG